MLIQLIILNIGLKIKQKMYQKGFSLDIISELEKE